MLYFKDALLEKLVVHEVGNKIQEDDLFISKGLLELKDEILYDMLKQYFLKPFKTEEFFQFQHNVDLEMNEVYNFASKIFENTENFYEESTNMARHLFDCCEHPNIKSGELYMAYINDVKIGEDFVECVGIFKSENKDSFLKVYPTDDNIELGYDKGVNINKLDKGCLIFNMEKEEGYRVCIMDAVTKSSDTARYWKHDFLNVKPREDTFFHTVNYMDMCKGFCDDVFNEANNVEKSDQILMMDKSNSYFTNHDNFNIKEFEEEVIQEPEVIGAFHEYKDEFAKKIDTHMYDEFDISEPAVKGQQKNFKNIIKLDKRFHLYVHGGHDHMERGFDDERQMKYYKLYYDGEE